MTKGEAFMAALKRLARLVAAAVVGTLAANIPGISDLLAILIPANLYVFAGPIVGMILNTMFKFLRDLFPEATVAKVL